jgi:hypothetical protein
MRTVALATVVLAALAGSASAQSPQGGTSAQVSPSPSQTFSPPSTDGRSTIPEAPVGHRQPTMRDLPPAVLREERSGDLPTSYERKLDRELQICRGC